MLASLLFGVVCAGSQGQCLEPRITVRDSLQNYSRGQLLPAAESLESLLPPVSLPSPEAGISLVCWSSVHLESGQEDVDVSV